MDLTESYEIGILSYYHSWRNRIRKIQFMQQASGRVRIQTQVYLAPEKYPIMYYLLCDGRNMCKDLMPFFS